MEDIHMLKTNNSRWSEVRSQVIAAVVSGVLFLGGTALQDHYTTTDLDSQSQINTEQITALSKCLGELTSDVRIVSLKQNDFEKHMETEIESLQKQLDENKTACQKGLDKLESRTYQQAKIGQGDGC
jgi:predicted RNase H-like nuclease (RuvC/YqgF family)